MRSHLSNSLVSVEVFSSSGAFAGVFSGAFVEVFFSAGDFVGVSFGAVVDVLSSAGVCVMALNTILRPPLGWNYNYNYKLEPKYLQVREGLWCGFRKGLGLWVKGSGNGLGFRKGIWEMAPGWREVFGHWNGHQK